MHTYILLPQSTEPILQSKVISPMTLMYLSLLEHTKARSLFPMATLCRRHLFAIKALFLHA